MGWFDGASLADWQSSSRHHRDKDHHRSSSHSRHHSSIFGSGKEHHNSSRSSFFGGNTHHHNSSRFSFFGIPTRSSSYYKRSPRSNYLKRIYSQLRRLLRDLIYYMKRHPMKVFVLVIMPLITGGALTGLLSKFGIRLPGGLEKMFRTAGGGGGGLGGMGGGRGLGRGHNGEMQWERSTVQGPLGALGGLAGGLGGAVGLAKMFM